MIIDEEKLRQLFKNNSDCYADTNIIVGSDVIEEGEVIQAMTEDKFIEVVTEYLQSDIKKDIVIFGGGRQTGKSQFMAEQVSKMMLEKGIKVIFIDDYPDKAEMVKKMMQMHSQLPKIEDIMIDNLPPVPKMSDIKLTETPPIPYIMSPKKSYDYMPTKKELETPFYKNIKQKRGKRK